MKINLLLSHCGLLLAALSLQNCAVDSKLIKTEHKTVIHEHRVHLPAAMYTAGSSNVPLFDKQGDLLLAVDFANSGDNTNDDKNRGGNSTNVIDGITHQSASSTKTFSLKGGYALTDRIGIIGSVTTGGHEATYKPYIESWNIQKSTYDNEYWLWLPLPWDVWNGYSWSQVDEITTINGYEKMSKELTRRYRYFDAELGVGKFSKKKKWKTEIYGGLGLAKNTFDGHLDRGTEVYGRHEATFYKAFVQPAAAFSSNWFEAGAAFKGSFMHYQLDATEINERRFESENTNLLFVEPSLFMRFGPRAFRVTLEQKWLACLGDSPFPLNKSYLSLGLVSMLNVPRKKSQE